MSFQLVASSRTLLSTSAMIPGSFLRHAVTTPKHICRTSATCQSAVGQHRKHIHSSRSDRTGKKESILCVQCESVQRVLPQQPSPFSLQPHFYPDRCTSSRVVLSYHRNVPLLNTACERNLLSQYTPLSCTNLDIVVRALRTEGSGGLRKEESKVEQTVNVLKNEIITKKEGESKDTKSSDTAPVVPQLTPEVTAKTVKSDAVSSEVAVKKTIVQRIVAELKHYYNGFKLLFIDVNVCRKYVWQLLNGQSLTRRERRQLVRTTADMFRLVPFLVFIIIPFMEFLLPVALKLFPNMLPSTFQEADKKTEKRRSVLKMKLEMAKFLQDTIEETPVQRIGAKGESAQQFAGFMEKIRTSGEPTSNIEILKYSKLFEDEITLDNLQYSQLAALCRLLEIPTVGPSALLRFQLWLKLRQLEADDRMIQKEGIDTLAEWELQDASRMRGMRSFGMPKERLKLQLEQWLDLHLNEKIPSSLLLLSRTLYMPEHLSASEQLVEAIRELPESTMEEAKVKISEVSGDRVDNKTKLEIIQKEEEAIREEIEETAKLEEAAAVMQKQVETAESLEKLGITPEDIKPVAPSAIETLQTDIPAKELLKDIATPIVETKEEVGYDIAEEISSEDLEQLEDALEQVAEKQMELKLEQQELAALKEDVQEYQEDLKDLKDVVVATGDEQTVMKESKGATRLSKQVERMISKMDDIMTSLNTEKDQLLENIELQEVKIKRSPKLRDDTDLRQTVLDNISEEKENLVSINELLLSIRRLQKVSPDTKLQTIVQVLDQDKDGRIDINNALQVIELLGRENVKISAKQMADITKLLETEQKVEEDIQKAKQEKRAAEESGEDGDKRGEDK